MSAEVSLKRVSLQSAPFQPRSANNPWDGRGAWKASWVRHPQEQAAPFVTAYRLAFTLTQPTSLRCHVTADERYELFLNGIRVGRGSERGDLQHWFFESYEGALPAGSHVIVARVWSLGQQAPFAQMSFRPGFLFAVDDPALSEVLDTGVAHWDVKYLDGYSFQSPLAAWGTGANVVIDGSHFDWDFQTGGGQRWEGAIISHPSSDDPSFNTAISNPVLLPATLPPMLDRHIAPGEVRHVAQVPAAPASKTEIRPTDHLPSEANLWQRFLNQGERITIPAFSRRRIIIDLNNYYCAYHQLEVTGGANSHIDVHWQESLYETADATTKGDRNAVNGKFFITPWHLQDGIGDRFITTNKQRRRFESLWWHCGRYIQLLVETGDEAIDLHSFTLAETRYPFQRTGAFTSSRYQLQRVGDIAWRTLEVCSHETYFDCPYFEQLQYIGDSRIEALVTYVSTVDSRLPRKAIAMFDWSRTPQGLTQSRYPCNTRQIIPGFSLLWIGMVYDYFMWREAGDFIRERLSGVRAVLDEWLRFVDSEGLINGLVGWNYLDWSPTWKEGVPPDGKSGGGASFNFLLQISLRQTAEMEAYFGENELSQRWLRLAERLAKSTRRHYWNEKRGLFADDRGQTRFSEHAQALAILANAFHENEQTTLVTALLNEQDLTKSTLYFTHYLFEALRILAHPTELIRRIDLWSDLHEHGLKTTIEMPEPTRSDCHAWSSHPLFHYSSTLLGIRPASPGFRTVEIAPQIGSLTTLSGKVPHPLGLIEVSIQRIQDKIEAVISLPHGLNGIFKYADQSIALTGTSHKIQFPEKSAVG
jgi:hypothetical protein